MTDHVTSLAPGSRRRHTAVVMLTRLAAPIVAVTVVAGAAGCTASAKAERPTAHVAQVPNPAQITHFDLVAYDRKHPTSSGASQLLAACVVPDHGHLVQVGISRSLARLGIARHGQGIALLLQQGATAADRKVVVNCLRSHGALVRE